MLCMAGWLRRGCSTSDVKRSSSSKQSIGLTDGCIKHGKTGESRKRQADLTSLSFVNYLFETSCHLHTGTAIG